jgi:hypothetical protein
VKVPSHASQPIGARQREERHHSQQVLNKRGAAVVAATTAMTVASVSSGGVLVECFFMNSFSRWPTNMIQISPTCEILQHKYDT